MISKLKKKANVEGASKVPAGQLAATRVDRDLANLSGTSGKVTPITPGNLLALEVVIKPCDGIWRGGEFKFRLNIPDSYPHAPPKCVYLGPTRMWHPNIEGDVGKTEWGVCLNILKADWTPVLSVRDVVFGLEMMFFEPNLEDPLPGTAREAAQQMKDDPRVFDRQARSWLAGKY
jgi:ubiquitin-conjugating enzyme E2 M